MKYFNASTKRGQNIISMGVRCCWSSLSNLYGTWSDEKQRAFDWCREQYINSENHIAFGVGNANNFCFTASWLCTINGENVLRVETKNNSYCVYLDK